MKKTGFILSVVALLFSSCLKKRTCTCKTASGQLVSTESMTPLTPGKNKSFEDKCKSEHILSVVDSTTISTPCVLN